MLPILPTGNSKWFTTIIVRLMKQMSKATPTNDLWNSQSCTGVCKIVSQGIKAGKEKEKQLGKPPGG